MTACCCMAGGSSGAGTLSGILQVAHGMCEHKERYLPFLQEMADHGYLCIIHDHRGHGESVRQPEDLGYFYPDGGTAIVSDLYQVTRWIREQYPELPLYLFGHSMVRWWCGAI